MVRTFAKGGHMNLFGIVSLGTIKKVLTSKLIRKMLKSILIVLINHKLR